MLTPDQDNQNVGSSLLQGGGCRQRHLPSCCFKGREVGQESRKRLFQPICICLAAINTDAFPAYREKAPRWASAWQAAQFFNP